MLQSILLYSVITILLLKLIAILFVHKSNPFHRDLHRKFIIVSGATSGVGRELVIDLFFKGAIVIFLGRRASLVQNEIIPEIKQRLSKLIASGSTTAALSLEDLKQDLIDLEKGIFTPKGDFNSKRLVYRRVDLADLTQIKAFADEVRSRGTPVDILINNAGSLFHKFSKTAQDIESNVGLNLVSNYYMVECLLDFMAKEGRIINTASCIHYLLDNKAKKLNLDEYFIEKQDGYFDFFMYARAKLGVVLFTSGLHQLIERRGLNVKAVCLHPGVVMSHFMHNLHPTLTAIYKLTRVPFSWTLMKSPAQGMQTTLYCSSIPYEQLEGGKYYSECGRATPSAAVTAENVNAIMQRCSDVVCKATKEPVKQLCL